jgi:hypothetical protein
MTLSPEVEMANDLAELYDDPLGYVLYAFPWDDEPAIQIVHLQEPWASRYGSKWGPDKWACEFLDDLGEEIRKRGFDGSKGVSSIRFSTASGHGIGKSAMVAWLIKFILDTRPFAKGVVTANTSEQLKTKTWAELGKWHGYSVTKHLYNYTAGRGAMALSRKSDPATWRCDAQTCREENAEAFQGLHAANSTPFFIFDEASGIPDPIWEARAGGLTDGEPMSFDFGNPTRKSGMFFENCIGKYRDRYVVRSIDSRNVHITNKELFAEWAEDRGEDSDFFKVKVKGEFPEAGDIQFISSDAVERAMTRALAQHEAASVHKNAPLIIGVDVARFGDNATVIYPRFGNDARSFGFEQYWKLSIPQVVDKVIATLQKFQRLGREVDGLFIDGGGLGGGVVDLLRDLGYGPIDVNFGSKPSMDQYRLKVDEMWGKMREAMPRLYLPDSDDLMSQLTTREYGFSMTGKLQIESKKDLAKRGGASPDIADALALTFAQDVNLTGTSTGMHPVGPVFTTHEWDPIAWTGQPPKRRSPSRRH